MADLTFSTLTSPAQVPQSVVAGSPFSVGRLNGFTVSLESVGVGTYQLQISLDTSNPPAAASWQNEGAALTAAGDLAVTKQAAWARWNCTAYTNGAPVGRVGGVKRV